MQSALILVIFINSFYCFSQCSKIEDSITLVALYNSTDGDNWKNTWNLKSNMDTWYGVKLNNRGCVSQLNLANNNLNGTLAIRIGDIKGLRFLYLSNNKITGNLPCSLGNLSELIILDLSFNQLSGSIPAELGNLDNLYWLVLNNNMLTGKITVELSQLSLLSNLALYQNQLSGEIPGELSKLQNLSDLFLGFNQLTGELPTSLTLMPNLSNLYVAHNKLTGCYAPELNLLCDFATSTTVSNGNNFEVSWNDFCDFNIGVCGGDNCVDELNLTGFLTEETYQAKIIIDVSTFIPASKEILFIAEERYC